MSLDGFPTLEFARTAQSSLEDWLTREWLLTDGLGGFASSTLAHCNTRAYHGLFIPSLRGLGRTVLLARMEEALELEGRAYPLTSEEQAEKPLPSVENLQHLVSFRLRGLVPEWEYAVGPVRLRKRVVLVHGENTLHVTYEHLEGPACALTLRPFPVFRQLERAVSTELHEQTARASEGRLELQATAAAPVMRLVVQASTPATFTSAVQKSAPQRLRTEQQRGYAHVEVQASPGFFRARLEPGKAVSWAVTTGDWARAERSASEVLAQELDRERQLIARAPAEAREGVGARLVLAADQFVIQPSSRLPDEPWAKAARSIVAGYHWFTDWGRDTMISLEGLTLSTGRWAEAAAILRTFAHYVRDGLLPNYFPDGESEGVYHTADATLWYFHAVERYLATTGDAALLRDLFPVLEDIIARHQRGTRFNIQVDPRDGLLRQGAEGYQLTWMDAKVEGWVVTPRRGKAVELNALWFNALKLMGGWAASLGKDGAPYLTAAERTRRSFNARFWNSGTGCLFDLVDTEEGGADPAIRPNQVLAISLEHPVLDREHWASVMRVVDKELLTPVGLRSLARGHPDYKPVYDGDLRSRDAAYHQGTVWGWLMGPYADAALAVGTPPEKVRALLEGLEQHLLDAGVGQLSEIFDATAPYRARGCIAQAWSVGEALRIFLRVQAASRGSSASTRNQR